ncbi:MAG: PTS sugar transporter subunit IIA [Kiritimatiellales bacterium]|nr:PTS sugar transporter subunit IIA [Kiritimatiellales bacterium]
MKLKKVLSVETVWVDLKSTTKQEIIEEMVDRLVAAAKITDKAAALQVLLAREQKMSTGMQNGVAIPHGKTDSVEELVAAVGLQKDGVDFNSLDGEPANLFIMTLSPLNRTGPHIQFIAEISRLLSSPEQRAAILAAKTNRAVLELLTGK